MYNLSNLLGKGNRKKNRREMNCEMWKFQIMLLTTIQTHGDWRLQITLKQKTIWIKNIWAHHLSLRPAQFLYQFTLTGMLVHKCVVPCLKCWYAFLQLDQKLLKGSDDVFYWVCLQPHLVALPSAPRETGTPYVLVC